MKKNWLYLFVGFLGCFLSSCAGQKYQSPTPADLSGGSYIKKVDNFLVVFDASSSMYESYHGRMKHLIAKDIVGAINATLPELDFQGGLRVFGPGIFAASQGHSLLYGMSPYSTADFAAAVATIPSPNGFTPLAAALYLTQRDLAGLDGKTAMIVISDGADIDTKPPIAAAANLKSIFGDRLCIYPILIGDSAEGKIIMEGIAGENDCGFAVTADDLNSSSAIGEYVEKVFLTPAAMDSDHDGVNDDRDRCPDTPAGVEVDYFGCPNDSDADGVYDAMDKCPDTPRGVKVDANGCPVPLDKKMTISLHVEFDFDKAKIRPAYRDHLRQVAEFMKAYPETRAVLEGHTDNYGTEAYNDRLSKQRAESVKNYLVTNFNINPSRLSTVGYGYSRPVATNATEEGRQQNRRVDAVIE